MKHSLFAFYQWSHGIINFTLFLNIKLENEKDGEDQGNDYNVYPLDELSKRDGNEENLR